MLKKTILEEKDLPKLLNLLEIENILNQEEQKVITTLQGINGSSILTIKSFFKASATFLVM